MNQVTRLSLVDRTADELSIVAQCRLLKVARSTLYWRPAAVLRRACWSENRKRVRRLMRIEAIYQIAE